MSRGQAFSALLLVLAAFFGPRLWAGEVVFPHDNAIELGLPEPESPSRVENRWFSDVSSFYVPELDLECRGERTGWLSTWNPHVELGRPAMQVSGLGRVSPLARVLLLFSDDAAVVFTWISVLTLVGCAVFAFLFLDALGLHPGACLASAAMLALGIHSLFWAGFVMYLAGPCWTLCFLWLATRHLRAPGLGSWIGIAFAIYALLLTAYPQLIVWEAYLAGGFLVHRLVSEPAVRGRRIRTILGILVAVLAGLACAAPLLADVAVQAARSSRSGVDAAYFLKSIPGIASARDLLAFLAQVFDVFWIGNPIRPEFPFEFRWISLAPVACGLLLASPLDGGWRKSGYWLGFAAICLVLTIWRDAYLFGVAHLGLGLSRFTPLAAATIPIAVLVATTLDRWIRDGVHSRALSIAATAAGPVLAALALPGSELGVDRLAAGVSIAFALLLALCICFGRASWIAWLALVVAFHYGRRVWLTRPESAIRTTSPLVERIREETRGGLRYAIVGFEDERLLPPNQEIRLGLSSVHSYDPLSAKAYSDWVLRISETGTRMYGRQFRRIFSDARLGSDEVVHAGIGVLVSKRELHAPGFVDAGPVDESAGAGMHVYRAQVRPALEAQISTFETDGPESVRLEGPIANQRRLAVERTRSSDDRLEFALTAAATPTLLFVSQQHHPHWRASGRSATGADAIALETVVVDGFWQGVLVPPGIRSVALEFRPWVRLAWIPHALFGIAAAAFWVVRFLRALPRWSESSHVRP